MNTRSSIKSPRITEKSTVAMATANAYVFNVQRDATKIEIARDIKAAFGVEPVKIRVVNLKARAVVRRGKRGTESGLRKAYVYLKKGDSIAII